MKTRKTPKTEPAHVTRTITPDATFCKRDANNLFETAVDLIANDNGALTDHGKVCTLVRLCVALSGIDYVPVYEAAVEVANARREFENRRWSNRIGVTAYKGEDFDIPTPKFDAISRALKGY